MLLILAFAAVAWSDVSSDQSRTYWTVVAALFGVSCLVMQWIHGGRSAFGLRPMILTGLLWLGVVAAVQIVYVFVDSGRFTNEDTGLVNGLVLAVGAYASGLFLQWRVAVVAVALAIGVVIVAFIEQYMLVLGALVIAAGVVMAVGAYFWARHKGAAAAE